MCAEREWRFRLEHIATAIDRILKYTEGQSLDDFRSDERTMDAVIRNFEIIGEAARHVPRDVRERHPSIPWSLMERMRHVLAHDYDVVDPEIVWRTIEVDIRPVMTAIKKVMEAESSESPPTPSESM